jgi:hypothetical protein
MMDHHQSSRGSRITHVLEKLGVEEKSEFDTA